MLMWVSLEAKPLAQAYFQVTTSLANILTAISWETPKIEQASYGAPVSDSQKLCEMTNLLFKTAKFGDNLTPSNR